MKNTPALNSHKHNTTNANNPHTDTHFVVIDTWAFDTLEHAFETKAEADRYRDLENLKSNTLHRYTVKERKGAF